LLDNSKFISPRSAMVAPGRKTMGYTQRSNQNGIPSQKSILTDKKSRFASPDSTSSLKGGPSVDRAASVRNLSLKKLKVKKAFIERS
jgi:hypothetical protein